MDRKTFLNLIALSSIANACKMKVNQFVQETEKIENTPKMPVFFFGHGSPMNALEDNEFVRAWKNSILNVPKPKAILCVSAHWETNGTQVTAMDKPKTIHDFGGFTKELNEVQYPAPGSLEIANLTKSTITNTPVFLDHSWGLDHGCWSVLKQIYPSADIPVLQLSLDYNATPQQHFDIAKQLSSLRDKGILIISSGNIVHHLGLVAWDKLNEPEYGYDWAIEANTKMKSFITNNQFSSLIDFKKQGKSFDLAIPTSEHFLPLLYTLALKNDNENIQFFNDKLIAGSLSMTSLMIN